MPKRDMDLVRKVVLHVESLPPHIGGGGFPHNVLAETLNEEFDDNLIRHHLRLLVAAGYLDQSDSGHVRGLTWAGHDFADSVRSEEIWSKTKEGARSAGGWTFDILKDLAKGYVKAKIAEKTGITL